MVDEARTKTGARLAAEVLAANGVAHVFAGPGAIPATLAEALRASGIRLVAAAQDVGAAMMAETTGRLTGRPGVCLVAGPAGALGALPAVRVADRDSCPMILAIVDVDPSDARLDAFETADRRRLEAGLAVPPIEIEHVDEIVAGLGRAFGIAGAGRPGPVAAVFCDAALSATAPAPTAIAPTPIVDTHPGAAAMWELQKRLWAAKRPLAVLGGSRWSETAVRRFARFAEKFDLPVACSFRRQSLFDHDDPKFVGAFGPDADPALAARLRAADLVLLVGGRLEERPGPGESPFVLPGPGQSLVHVHVDVGELGRIHRPDLALHASPTAFAAAAEGLEPPPAGVAWADWRAAARADHEAWVDLDRADPILRRLVATLTDEAIVAGDRGAAAIGLHRFRRFRRFGTQAAAIATIAGRGLPAGIAAALAHPDRPVIAITDVVDFAATGPEFATAVREGAAVIAIVFDEEPRDPRDDDRVVRPDLAAIARAQGGFGATVERAEAFGPALDAALAHGGAALLHVRI